MTGRAVLPSRRTSEIGTITAGGVEYRFQISRGDKGGVLEIFLDGGKLGSAAQIAARDAAIATSLALQHGCTTETLRHALQKNHGGSCAGPVGMVLDITGKAL